MKTDIITRSWLLSSSLAYTQPSDGIVTRRDNFRSSGTKLVYRLQRRHNVFLMLSCWFQVIWVNPEELRRE